MNGFDEIQFPLRLALGAVGGPERRTDILTLASGREIRNATWSQARRRWDVGGAVSDLASLHALISFFEARQGRLRGFRFHDPVDHASAPPGSAITPLDQVLGIGDDVTADYQLVKAYGATLRPINKPVAGSVRIALDEVELATGWSLEPTTGRVHFDVAPPLGAVVTAGYAFDCAVRFDTDRLEGVIEAFGAGRVASVGLIELAA